MKTLAMLALALTGCFHSPVPVFPLLREGEDDPRALIYEHGYQIVVRKHLFSAGRASCSQGKIFIREGDLTEGVLAHEYTHVLQAEHFGCDEFMWMPKGQLELEAYVQSHVWWNCEYPDYWLDMMAGLVHTSVDMEQARARINDEACEGIEDE